MADDPASPERKVSWEDRIYQFDLSKLSLTGWLLSLSTLVIFAIAVSIIAVFGDTVGVDPNQNSKGVMKFIAFVMMFIAVAWFVAGKFLLEALGFSIVRREQPKGQREGRAANDD